MARPRETAKTKLIRLLLLLVNILTLVRPLRPRPRPSRAVPWHVSLLGPLDSPRRPRSPRSHQQLCALSPSVDMAIITHGGSPASGDGPRASTLCARSARSCPAVRPRAQGCSVGVLYLGLSSGFDPSALATNATANSSRSNTSGAPAQPQQQRGREAGPDANSTGEFSLGTHRAVSRACSR
jgi:hypothetical protein